MQRVLATRVLCCLFVVLLPATLLFADMRGAMLYGTGITVNGAAVSRSAAVLAGDRIVTSAAGSTTIAAAGSRVVMAGNSSLVYRGASIELTSGAVSVATSEALPTQVGNLRIVPAAKSAAQYQISAHASSLLISATHGALALSMNGVTTILPEGATWSGVDPQNQPKDPNENKNSKKKGAAIVRSDKLIVVGAVALTAGIAVAAGLSSGETISPTRPH